MADELNNQYQGTQGHEQEVIKVEGLKASLQKMKDDLLGIPNTSEAVKYTQAEADAYNAQLTGALDDTTPLTAEQATAYNTAIAGATKEAGDTLSEAEANLYNATLDGAVTTDDVKTPAVPTKVKDYVDTEVAKKYTKPTNGIPKSDLASGVKTSLGKADTSVQGVAYDTTNKKITETIGSDTTDVVTAYKIVEDGGGIQMKLLDLFSLAHDYSFKKNDALLVGGAIYKATADTTAPPFDFVFDANNSIVVDRINGQDAVVCDSLTLNTGWEKVLDLTDRYYTEERIKTRFDYANDGNVAVLGNGYGVCETAATTAAKVVTIGNFILKTNGIVSVRFTSAIDAADATLNVNGTGAKTIRINGSNIQPGAVRAGNTVIFQYDGTYWNVVSVQGLEQGQAKSETWVDLGLPSGLKWAKQNIAPSGFCSSPFAYICAFFSWGNIEGHTPTNDTFSYDFGSSNSGPYASTPGAKLTGSISPSMDAARAICGAPWRMPTSAEFQELFDNCVFVQADGTTEISASTTNKLVTVDGIVGIYLKSKKNGNNIFFPCSGDGDGTSWNNRGSYGLYWSSSFYSATGGWNLDFRSGGVYPQGYNSRFLGFAIRPVF